MGRQKTKQTKKEKEAATRENEKEKGCNFRRKQSSKTIRQNTMGNETENKTLQKAQRRWLSIMYRT